MSIDFEAFNSKLTQKGKTFQKTALTWGIYGKSWKLVQTFCYVCNDFRIKKGRVPLFNVEKPGARALNVLNPVRIEFANVDFCGWRKTGESQEKPSEQDENQQQTQPAWDGKHGKQTRVEEVGGERLFTPQPVLSKRNKHSHWIGLFLSRWPWLPTPIQKIYINSVPLFVVRTGDVFVEFSLCTYNVANASLCSYRKARQRCSKNFPRKAVVLRTVR